MNIEKINRLELYSKLKRELCDYTKYQIEEGIVSLYLSEYGYDISNYKSNSTKQIVDILKQNDLPIDLEIVSEFFETLIEDNKKDECGMVFTPRYISEYISKSVFEKTTVYSSDISVLDPSCGCGNFLVSAVEILLDKFDVEVDYVIENNIYGIDVDEDNIRRCILTLKLLSAKHGGNFENIKPNLACDDSLRCNWAELFGVNSFSHIIGNPPYINPHNMTSEEVQFCKSNFLTTQKGCFNMFYAFIEYGMSFLEKNGVLGYIVPHNVLTIKSALDLRKYLKANKFIKRIINFGENTVFESVRTHNCIIFLSLHNDSDFEYCVIPKNTNIENSLLQNSYSRMTFDELDNNGWNLIDDITSRNIRKIESQPIAIKDFIRTGIATLRDNVFLVDKDENGYYKALNDENIYIESGLIKSIYKVSELKQHDNVECVRRFIIFPYIKSDNGYELIDEEEFMKCYPKTYQYLCRQRKELDLRDGGKGIPNGWYAYGRTQGLNKYGKKLLFPTFSKKPKFKYIDSEDDLFCNGYAIFENDIYELDILQKIFNSKLMDYYVRHTSYSIKGGFYCYQKKYIERFSLPRFSKDEIAYIRNASDDKLDDYLWELYGLE